MKQLTAVLKLGQHGKFIKMSDYDKVHNEST